MIRSVPTAYSAPRWRKMTWVVWRQDRAAISALLALLAALSGLLVVSGNRLRTQYAELLRADCFGAHPVTGCPDLVNAFFQHTSDLGALNAGLRALPILAGIFIGAPLVARELESGTFQLVWTQGLGRYRWLTAKLVLVGLAIAVLICAVATVAAWWASPIYAAGVPSAAISRWPAGAFDVTAVTLPCWGVLSFACGVLAGAVIRRSVQAMAATAVILGLLSGLAYAKADGLLALAGADTVRGTALQLGQSAFMTASPTAGPHGSWVLRQWVTTPKGTTLDMYKALRSAGSPGLPGMSSWLARHHDVLRWTYDPASHYWPLQVLDGTILLACSVLVGGAAIAWLRSRAA